MRDGVTRPHYEFLPCASANLAIPPRTANTCSPYLMGMRFVFHRPACMTDAKSMFSANRSCVTPTQIE